MPMRMLIPIPDRFNRSLSRASQTVRMGYLHGALREGLSARLVEYRHLRQTMDAQVGAIVWLTYDDYRFLDEDTLRLLRNRSHIVNVNVWFDGMEALHERYNAPNPAIPEELRRRVLDSEPDFVWSSAPEAYLAHYEGWRKAGARVVSLPWACDVTRYYPSPSPQFSRVDVAFVGGYRPYKEPQYAERLWPYEDRLHVWGYSEWPRCYRGYLPNELERILYTQAVFCPTLSEPQFAVTGDTVERPFKIMGCQGLTVLDIPCYRELFHENEVLIAPDVSSYGELVERLFIDRDLCAEYRRAGYKAVLARHTYAHRVQTILDELCLK